MELDVSPSGMAAAKIAAGEVTVGQLNFEYVVTAWFAFVAHPDSGRAGLTINRDVVLDNPTIGIIRINLVAGHRRRLHVHPVAVINVIEMAPERAVLDAAAHTEVAL